MLHVSTHVREYDVTPGEADDRVGIEVTHIAEAEWRTLRDLRLQALSESAHMLLGDYAAEEQHTPREWASICRDSLWLAGLSDGKPVGLAHIADYPDEDPRYHLESVWVKPADRKNRLGGTLVRYAEGLVRDMGEMSLGLWLFSDNHEALGFYENLGYSRTGKSGAIEGRKEIELARNFSGGS